jgi:quinoprotein glucose dehydrogenase
MAAKNRSEDELKLRLSDYREIMTGREDSQGVYHDTLLGGNAANGKKVFFGKTEVSCVRCHRVDAVGGEVGPDLSGIANKHDRKYLLDAIVDPNKIITEGYAQVKVLTIEGLVQVGLVTKETETELRLLNADGVTILIAKDDIEDIKPGMSAMPDDLVKQLSLFELRDLIEYLASLKTAAQRPEASGH